MPGNDTNRSWDQIASELVVEVSLFLSSYAPLFLIMAVRFRTQWLDVVCYSLFFVGACSGYLVVRRYSAISGQQWTATAVEDRGYEVAGYLASYLLPFVTVTEPEWRDLAGYTIFLFVAGVVYIRSGMFQINPTLYLMAGMSLKSRLGTIGSVMRLVDAPFV
jgi:hypothetical protein